MSPYQISADVIQAVMDGFGDDCPSFQWGLDVYKVIPGSAVMRKSLADGGFSMSFDLKLHVLVGQFLTNEITTVGQVKDALLRQKISYLGDVYQIESVTIAPGGLQFVIEANALNQSA